ncbi:MAG TPA: efflux RND transporter periplasmic adaptor subunit [Gemmatimonadaceae bacterium]|jgi:cobalt-zinc-cadmium efflux system membrane fusion protein|nr:efflux RND transporter periplasmic adaptor subunit [Gemmatimonadaceae bacterium]
MKKQLALTASAGVILVGTLACTSAKQEQVVETVSAGSVPTPAPDTALLGAHAAAIAGIDTVRVARATWRDEWKVPARLALDPEATQAIGSLVEGRVSRVLVLPGERVRPGQLLVAINSPELLDARQALVAAEASLVSAESDLRLAASSAARTERLYAAKAASLADLERERASRTTAEAARARLAAEVQRARATYIQLGGAEGSASGQEARIRSPIDGVVVSRDAEPGQVVSAGTPIVTVSRMSSLALIVQAPEEAVGSVKTGAALRFTVRAYPGRDFQARITRVAPALDPRTRTLEVVARVDNPSGELRPEMFATVALTGKPAGEVLAIPSTAVQALDGDTVVIAAAPRGSGLHVEALPVRIGRRNAELAEVLGGVKEGALVVTTGAAIARAEIVRAASAEER